MKKHWFYRYFFDLKSSATRAKKYKYEKKQGPLAQALLKIVTTNGKEIPPLSAS